MTDSLITFSDELEMEFKQMAFVLENVESACWIYVVYNQAVAREKIIDRLQNEIALPFFLWDYSAEKPYPIDYLRDLTEEQKQNRAVISFFNTVDGGDKTIKSLDFNREKFALYPHSLIFWVTENELGEMARKAGHFWAQRRGTFRFSKLIINELEKSEAYDTGGWLNKLLSIKNHIEASQELKFYKKLLTEYEIDSKQHLIAETADKISYLLYYLGRYSEAIKPCNTAFNVYQSLLGDNNLFTFSACNNLAFLYNFEGRYDEAKHLFQKILRQNIEQSFIVATVLNNLAWSYREQGLYEKAEFLCSKSLNIRISIFNENHPSIANSLNNLGLIYNAQGKYAEAEILFKKALAIRKNSFNKEHPRVASSLNYLASLYAKQGKYVKAEELYIEAINIALKTLGQNHPSTRFYEKNYEQLLLEKAARHKLNPP